MEEESLRFWIIPILCLGVVMFGIFPMLLHHQITVVQPNAETELVLLNAMSCDSLKDRNALGSYATPENASVAREKVKACMDAEKEYKADLGKIRREGTHQEKLDAGFTKLWFGVYDHPDMPYRKVPATVKIPLGTINDASLYPSSITVIQGYNNTIKFLNQDIATYTITAHYNAFSTDFIHSNQTESITVDEPGVYEYFSKPWMQGNLTVLENPEFEK